MIIKIKNYNKSKLVRVGFNRTQSQSSLVILGSTLTNLVTKHYTSLQPLFNWGIKKTIGLSIKSIFLSVDQNRSFIGVCA